jgi:ferrous iron transport protein B
VLLKKVFFKREDIPFVMELPPYRLPTIRSIFKHVWFRTGLYLKKIGGVILLASIIVWVLSNFPKNVSYSKDFDSEISAINRDIEEQKLLQAFSSPARNSILQEQNDKAINKLRMEKKSEEQSNSFIGIIGRTVEPVMKPLGFDWRLSVSILSGLAAKEVVVSTLGIIYQADNEEEGNSLVEKIQQQKDPSGNIVFTPLIAFSFMLFILTYFPCIGVVAAIKRESGSWKWAAFVVIYTSAVAWLLSFSVYQIGSLMQLN